VPGGEDCDFRRKIGVRANEIRIEGRLCNAICRWQKDGYVHFAWSFDAGLSLENLTINRLMRVILPERLPEKLA
jgi:hypothetical protein